MTSKTAIMQAIDKIHAGAEALNEDFNSEYNYKLGMLHAKKILKKLLATEKQQLIEAHREGQEFATVDGLPDSEDYYLKTYAAEPEFPKDRNTGNRDTV